MEVINIKVKKGDIYYATLGAAVGSEQGGTRPVVILKSDNNMYWATAITSQCEKKNIPTHFYIGNKFGLHKSTVLLEQIRTFKEEELMGKVGEINDDTMKIIYKKFFISVGMMRENDSEIKRGDVFYLRGNKKIPVVLVQNNLGNKYGPTTIVCELEKTDKNNHDICIDGVYYNLKGSLNTIDKSRLEKKIGRANEGFLSKIDEMIRIL